MSIFKDALVCEVLEQEGTIKLSSDILDNPFDITVSLSSPISTGNINIKLKKENFTLKIGSIIKLTFPKEHIFFF